MFTTRGLFRQVACPTPKCARINCPFSHVPVKHLVLPLDDLKSLAGSDQLPPPVPVTGKRLASPSSSSTNTRPAKLPRIENSRGSGLLSNIASSSMVTSLPNRSGSPASFSTSKITSSSTSLAQQGPPKLLVNPAQSKIPYATRQAMITTLYGAFKDLYHLFHVNHPEVAHIDALAQEAEVYVKTNKQSYKNVRLIIYILRLILTRHTGYDN